MPSFVPFNKYLAHAKLNKKLSAAGRLEPHLDEFADSPAGNIKFYRGTRNAKGNAFENMGDKARADKAADKASEKGWSDKRPQERGTSFDARLNKLKREGGVISKPLAHLVSGTRNYLGHVSGVSADSARKHAEYMKNMANRGDQTSNRLVQRAAGIAEARANRLTSTRKKVRLGTAVAGTAAYGIHRSRNSADEQGYYDPNQNQGY